MFSLTGAVNYRYIPGYRDMRGGYDKLCGVVRLLGADYDLYEVLCGAFDEFYTRPCLQHIKVLYLALKC